jgi:hypothetical protein
MNGMLKLWSLSTFVIHLETGNRVVCRFSVADKDFYGCWAVQCRKRLTIPAGAGERIPENVYFFGVDRAENLPWSG